MREAVLSLIIVALGLFLLTAIISLGTIDILKMIFRSLASVP